MPRDLIIDNFSRLGLGVSLEGRKEGRKGLRAVPWIIGNVVGNDNKRPVGEGMGCTRSCMEKLRSRGAFPRKGKRGGRGRGRSLDRFFQFLTTLTRVERKNRKFRGVNDVQRERGGGRGNYRLRRRNDARTIRGPMFTALRRNDRPCHESTMLAVRGQAFREINRGYYDRAAERIPLQTAG